MLMLLKFLIYWYSLTSACGLAKGTNSDPWRNVTGTSSETFPTDVGFLGNMKYGAKPFLAQKDRLNTSRSNNDSSVEMRWLPWNAEEDAATSDDIFRNLGTTSPYHQAFDLFPETIEHQVLPPQCKIKSAHILHRHGSRYPAGPGGPSSLGRKIKLAQKTGQLKAHGDFEFLEHWEYDLGEDVLVHKGAQELFDSGVKYYYEYAKLLENYDKKPVIRTTSQSRMVDSARYWALGFFGWDMQDKVNIEVLTETFFQNNTLAPYMSCPNPFSPKVLKALAWRFKMLKKATDRINKHVKGITFSSSDVSNMISLCGYETVALGYSNFCKLFTKQDFEEYEYEQDLMHQSVFGFMSVTSKAWGVGWVTEFIHRLKHKAFDGPQTSQNSTLDHNPKYFPVHQPLYVDFTHDIVIESILTALNFKQLADELDGDRMQPNRRFRTSHVVPFGARLVFEVMECDENGDKSEYIRAKLNDAVVPLDGNQGCESRLDGLCRLDNYLSHLEKHAFQNSNFDFLCRLKIDENFDLKKLLDGGILSNDDLKQISKTPPGYHEHHKKSDDPLGFALNSKMTRHTRSGFVGRFAQILA